MKIAGEGFRNGWLRLLCAGGQLAVLMVLAAYAGPLAFADDRRETFALRAGLLFFTAEGSFASVKEGGRPIYVDLDTVGINDDDRNLFASAIWNIADRWVLRLDAFGFHNDGARVADRDFQFDETVVSKGARVEGELDLEIYMMNFGYRFIDRERWELGAGLGVHYISLDYAFRAGVGTPGGSGVTLVEGGSKERLTDKLGLTLDGGYLSANYGDYEGRIYFMRGALEYDFSDHFGVGAGYWKTDFDVDRDTGKKFESYNVNLPGPQIYLKARF